MRKLAIGIVWLLLVALIVAGVVIVNIFSSTLTH